MSAPSPNAKYDWTFNYKLSRLVYCKESNDDSTIKFVKDSSNNLTGFKIGIENEIDSKASEKSEMKKKRLEKILTILSGMELTSYPTDVIGEPKDPGLKRVCNDFRAVYDIEGQIDKVDVADPKIGNMINQDMNPELDYLSKAVAHKSHGRYSESIKEAFRVIDEEKSAKHYSTYIKHYDKYQCIRNILSHREGQELHKRTKDNFTKFFNPVRDAFDFMYYDDVKGIVVLDSDSPKTQATLDKLAKDLIQDVRGILGL